MTQEVASMNSVLAQLRRSGAIYFLKSLAESAIQKYRKIGKYAELTMPKEFVQENGHKIEEWVILRAHLSGGRTSRPWLVRLGVSKTMVVRIGLGWHSFVTANHLKKGDSLIFLLKEDARSEFEVYMFRGPEGSPHFPNEGENSPIDEEDKGEYVSDSEEENSKLSRSPSPSPSPSLGHYHIELSKTGPRTQHLEKHCSHPGFRKRLTATNIQSSNGDRNSAQFHFPWSFVKTHGNQLHGTVKLQGIHEKSPTYLVTCRRSPRQCLKAYFVATQWRRFVEENGLKNGHELQFSLIDESYFAVRKI